MSKIVIVANDFTGKIIHTNGRKWWNNVHARISVVVAMCLFAPLLAYAQDEQELHPFLSKRFFTSVGLYFPDRSFKFEFDGTRAATFANEPVDFSEEFRLDGYDLSGAIELGWRYSKNWIFRGQYFRVSDSNSVVLDSDVEWGDATFLAGSAVRAGTEVEVTRLFFGRTFRSSDHDEIGFGGGLHWLEIGAFISGKAIVDGMDDGFHYDAVSVEGPMPNFGAWYIHSFSPEWAMNIRFDWLSASVDKYSGRILNTSAGVTYAMSRNFGVGLSYDYFELDLGIDDETWRGSAKIRFHGLSLHLRGYW